MQETLQGTLSYAGGDAAKAIAEIYKDSKLLNLELVLYTKTAMGDGNSSQ